MEGNKDVCKDVRSSAAYFSQKLAMNQISIHSRMNKEFVTIDNLNFIQY